MFDTVFSKHLLSYLINVIVVMMIMMILLVRIR